MWPGRFKDISRGVSFSYLNSAASQRIAARCGTWIGLSYRVGSAKNGRGQSPTETNQRLVMEVR